MRTGLNFFLCQWDSTLILLSVLHNLAAFLCLCAFLEKYMFLWFSLKEVFLITKQDELNSLFYKVDNFMCISLASLSNMMLKAMEE